jgi:inorganic triphosphatase YgiF
MTSDLVEQIQKLAREQHEGDFGKAARAYFRDHPSEWAAYRDESSVRVAKQAEDPGGIAAEVHYAIEHIAYRDHLYLEKAADWVTAGKRVFQDAASLTIQNS